MSTLSNPGSAGNVIGRVPNPANGTIRYKAETGIYEIYFPAQKDDGGNVVKEMQIIKVEKLKAFVLGTGFFKIIGGRPDVKTGTFIPCRSPLYCTTGGKKWEQEIAVYVGDKSTPEITGKWADVRGLLAPHQGRFCSVYFVMVPEYKDQIFMMELKGMEITAMEPALKGCGMKWDSELTVGGLHYITHEGNEGYQINKSTIYKPILKVGQMSAQQEGYSRAYALALAHCAKIDRFMDYLFALQKKYDTPAQDEAPVTTTHDEAPVYALAPEPTKKADDFEDLPF